MAADQKVNDVVAPVITDMGLELDALEVVAAGRRRVVRVTLDGDGANGHGPDLEEIADATRAISDALDESNVMGETPYTLEVSSRGVSTPLTKPSHYRRNAGRLVKLTVDGESEPLLGRIQEATDETVTVVPEAEMGPKGQKQKLASTEPRELAISQIRKAVVQIELNRKDDDELFADFDDESDDDFEEEN